MTRSGSLGVLLDHAQDKVALLDEAGRFTYANRAVERILGYEPSELLGENSFEYVHPEDVAEVRAAFEQTIAAEEYTESTVEYRFRAAGGDWVWLESRLSNLTDEELDGYVVSSRSVSDRVAAQRERRETADRLQEIAAATGEVLFMFSGDWSELLFVNPSYETVFGQPVAALEDDPQAFVEAIHPQDRAAVEAAMERLTAGESVDMEYRVNPERGYGVWVWVQAEPILEDGEVVRITGFCRDVTDRKRRERQLYVMDNLLRHNLRNDLGVILGNAELIENRAPEVEDRTAIIRETGEGLLASAEKERSIIEMVTGDPSRTRLDLVDAVEVAVEAVTERYPAATIELTAPETVTCYALDELRAAVVELLENAVSHDTSEGPAVSVTVAVEGEWATLTVTDEAAPIPSMEARVLTGDHEMSDVYHSSGLGLWLVHWAVELSGGHVEVDADEDGNRIVVVLPLARTPA